MVRHGTAVRLVGMVGVSGGGVMTINQRKAFKAYMEYLDKDRVRTAMEIAAGIAVMAMAAILLLGA